MWNVCERRAIVRKRLGEQNPEPGPGLKLRTRPGFETECRIGIRMKSVTAIVIEIKNGTETRIESGNEIRTDRKFFLYRR
ncbi:hypothetical protein EVAR_80133_1 [Eumeta japonica]|uniref:Uncharacterized protein n=1 Tax=Eumeta variegata TaxID=151549 RepID=A0A4C1YIB0_EUMVA|nr:hypothetical protein EVAR_80133_1 [Eumeta japonica]